MKTSKLLLLLSCVCIGPIHFLTAQNNRSEIPEKKQSPSERQAAYGNYLYWEGNDLLRIRLIQMIDSIQEQKYYTTISVDEFDKYQININQKESISVSPNEFEDMNELVLEDLNNIPRKLDPDSIGPGKEWKKTVRNAPITGGWDLLFSLLGLKENNVSAQEVANNISWLQSHITMQLLSSIYDNQMKEYPFVAPAIRLRNKAIIGKHLANMERGAYVHYKSNESGMEAVKEISLIIDNDILCPLIENQDREYTGGGKLTFSSDYFKARWLNTGWLSKRTRITPRRTVLSYQAFSIGMHFFTPYIRYRNNFDLADTLFQFDRPFGSYIYGERLKFRLWPKGLVRQKGSFQIGQIGSNAGRNIQALLHRDAVVESQKVYGWDNQIASGGRWLIQLEQTWDFLLYSTTNPFHSVFSPYTSTVGQRSNKPFGLNVIATANGAFGGYKTYLGGGLRIASSDFTYQSGENMIKLFNYPNLEFGLYLEAGINYRYVIHNSMLEGFGYLTTYKDDAYDDESRSVYTLNEDYYEAQNALEEEGVRYDRTPADQDQLNRHLLMYDMKVNIRFRRMTLSWQLVVHTKKYAESDIDYNSFAHLVDTEDREFYRNKAISELNGFRDRKFYGYGRLGMSWLLGE